MSKFRNQQRAAFWTADDLGERHQQAKEARQGGSITPLFSKTLRTHVQTGRVRVHTSTTVAAQRFDEESGLWDIKTDPAVPDLPQFDHVYFATGAHIDVGEVGFLRTIRKKFPVEMYGGLPALTDDLKWRPDVPLFVTGKLATLQIGPGAANLEGARLSAERVAWAIDEILDESHALAEGGHAAIEEHRHRYTAGVGSRYSQLSEK